MPIIDNRPQGGGGGAVTSVNGQSGVVVITKANVGLSNADNTSDLNKPISTLQQAALDTKVSLVASPDIEPDNFIGYQSYSNDDFFFRPLQNSPDESWNIFDKEVIIDPDSSGFTMGTNGQMAAIFNLNFNHQGTSDIGGLTYFNTNNSIGNGTDPVDVNGISLFYGFGSINANVNLSGPLQGYGFQYSINAAATIDAYITGFYDSCNIATMVKGYTSYNASPTIANVDNNTGVIGFNANANIAAFTGNGSYTGFSMSGNFAGFGANGGVQGLIINPTVSGSHYYNGIYSSTSAVTPYAGLFSSLVIQDLTYTFNAVGDNNSFQIEYTDSVTAGNEVASISGTLITITIESGVSTALQVKAALEANLSAVAALTVTVSGVGGNAQVTAAATNFTGGENAGSAYAGFFDGDVNITGDLTFGGALSIGRLNAFGTFAAIDGGGNPNSVHSLISQITVANNQTIANVDTFGLNTASLIDIGDDCVLTSGFLGLGMTSLGLPAVFKIGANSTLDGLGATVFALSIDAASGAGSVVNQAWGGRFLPIPSGPTVFNRYYGIWSHAPIGNLATDNWGLYLEDCEKNYIEGALKIGGSDVPDTGFDLHVDGKVQFLDDLIQLGSIDPFARTQIWNKATNASLRLGSLGQDGDPTDVSSEGSVFYGSNSQGTAINSGTGDFGYARVKADRFGLYTSIANIAFYYFRADPTSLYLKNDSNVKTFEVDRATGDTTVLGNLVAGSISSIQTQVDCLDNATEIIIVGSTTAHEMYELNYVVELNVSGLKRSGIITLGFDGAIFFDDEENYSGSPIVGLDIQPSVSGGNLRIEVSLAAVGENSKIKFSVNKIGQIV